MSFEAPEGDINLNEEIEDHSPEDLEGEVKFLPDNLELIARIGLEPPETKEEFEEWIDGELMLIGAEEEEMVEYLAKLEGGEAVNPATGQLYTQSEIREHRFIYYLGYQEHIAPHVDYLAYLEAGLRELSELPE